MKRIINYIALVAAMLAATSCVEPLDHAAPAPGQAFTLSFSCGTMTKATEPGVDNENLIKRIDYFIFPLNAQGEVDNTAKSIFHDYIEPTDGGLGITYSKTYTHDQITTIFANGATKVKLFAVANYVDEYGAAVDSPNTTIPTDSEGKITWKALHELEVGETFFKDGGEVGNNYFGLRWPRKMNPDDPNLFFVMTGEETITLQQLSTEIKLRRLASKVTIKFTFSGPVLDNRGTENTDDDITWVPQSSADETRVYLSNAIEHTTLGGPLTRDLVADSWDTCTKPEPGGDGTRDIFEYAYDFLKTDVITTDGNGNKIAHYYTYPISMKKGDDNQPYLKLVLPWYGYKDYGTANQRFYKQKEVYYKIVIPSATVNEGNRIYEYTAAISIVNNDKDVSINGDYVVKDWLSNTPISTNVATGRYISLDIPKEEYDMYVNLIDIAFVSSGKVVYTVDEIYQLDLHGSSPEPQYFMQNGRVTASNALRTKKGIATGEAGDNVIKSWVTIPENTSYLRINHTMDNRMNVTNQQGTSVPNTAFDMSPYVFKVTLHLEDAGNDPSFDRTVTITQYPSMYVTSTQSNGSVWVNNYTYGATSTGQTMQTATDPAGLHYSYAYNSNGQYNNNRIGSITLKADALTTQANNNGFNMIVHPTVLDSDLRLSLGNLPLMLGDSRVSDGGPLANITGVSNYRPTRTDVNNIVSPGFMIASSYGKTMPMSFTHAKERCASYQENGYPAGRWRLPSPGEIEFLVSLSNNGFIPSLFDGDYWASNERYYTSTSGSWSNNGSGNHYVRCIYDTWYWGEEPYQANATTWLGFRD